MKTIAILGAAGRIGDATSRAFVKAGWHVKGVGRNRRTTEMAPGVEPVKADAFERDQLIAATAGADVILSAVNPADYAGWEGTVLPMAENAVAAAKAAGATLMLPGNVYNFGHGIGLATGEDAEEAPTTGKAKIRIALERYLREQAEENGVRSIVLRAGDFYGGRKPGSWLDLLILSKIEKGIFTWPGPWDCPHAFAYLPDLADTFVKLAENRAEFGDFERFHFAGHTLTGAEMQRLVEQAVGRTLKRAGVPWTLLRAAGIFKPLYREIAVMSYLWRTAHSLDGSKLEKAIGPVPATPPAVAISEALSDLGITGGKIERKAA